MEMNEQLQRNAQYDTGSEIFPVISQQKQQLLSFLGH